MNSVIELLAAIEKRPTMYLSMPYISCLKAFLDGWLQGRNETESTADAEFLLTFQLWLSKKLREPPIRSWHRLILNQSEGETYALDNFFAYFNEWLALQSKPLARKRLLGGKNKPLSLD
jgi:hypothetical protein